MAAAFAIVTLARAFVVDVYTVPSGSMEPALEPGDRILVLKWPWQRKAELGDVVVFDGRGSLSPSDPESVPRTLAWLGGRNAGDQFVKRVSGTGSDRLSCDGAHGPLILNGKTAETEGSGDCGAQKFDVLVPEGRLWLMGDNRAHSRDSRSLLGAPGGGAVRESRVVGRVILVWQ